MTHCFWTSFLLTLSEPVVLTASIPGRRAQLLLLNHGESGFWSALLLSVWLIAFLSFEKASLDDLIWEGCVPKFNIVLLLQNWLELNFLCSDGIIQPLHATLVFLICKSFFVVVCFFGFLATLCSLQDLSSPTRDRTWAPGSESAKS